MSQLSRQKRLFRPNLSVFTKALRSVESFALENQDDSWIWRGVEDGLVEQNTSNPQPLCMVYAPQSVKESGEAYAKWCILTAAVSFQVVHPSMFLERMKTWWGSGSEPQYDVPTTKIGWSALFDKNGDRHFDARCEVAKEVMTSKSWSTLGKGWEAKIAHQRMFNTADALQLANAFKKSFSDPFLTKAQRALWQFVEPYKRMGQSVEIRLTAMANPSVLLNQSYKSMNVVAMEKLRGGKLMRDELIDVSLRSFIILNPDSVENSKRFEWLAIEKQHNTTDY
jgi:hypothetical protein